MSRELARIPVDEFRLSDPEIRVLRFACEYCRDLALNDDNSIGVDPRVWSGMVSEYRKTLIAVWAAGRNGGWIEDKHAANLYYGGLLYLSRDLTKVPYFTIGDAQTLQAVIVRLGRIVQARA